MSSSLASDEKISPLPSPTLKGLVALRRRHSFLLAVDEAHAALVCGEAGGGAAEAMGVSNEVNCFGVENQT